jgi:hypothetical protein
MIAFRFTFEKVLEWRRAELEAEEGKFRLQAAAAAALDGELAALEADGIRAETTVRQWRAVLGSELSALAEFRRHIRQRELQLLNARTEARQLLAERRAAMMEARRRCRLLERLKERRQAEWKRAADRELEQFAAEAHLARWGKEETDGEDALPGVG